MNTRTTIAVLLIAIALAAYFLVFEMDKPVADTSDTPAAPKLGEPLLKSGELAADKVRKIHLVTDAGVDALLEREGKKNDDWYQTQPVRFAMQGFQIRDIIADVNELRYTSTLKAGDKGMTLDKLGLQPPRGSITFEGDGVNRTITLGREAGVGRAYVVLGKPEPGATVYVVSDRLHNTILRKQLRDLRSNSLANIEPGRATRITLQQPEQTIELRKSDENTWTLTHPVTGRADKDAAQELVRAISTAFIDAFVQDNPKNLAIFGLDKPTYVLTVEAVESVDTPAAEPAKDTKADAKGEAKKEAAKPAETTAKYKLTIGAPVDMNREKYFAMWQDAPVVFQLRKGDVDKLQKKIDELRDARLTPTAKTDVKEITIEGKAGKVHVAQEGGAWAFADPKPDFTLDPAVMDDLLAAIFDTRAVVYVPLQGAKLAEPIAEITLGITARPEPEKLTVRPAEGTQVMVTRGNESAGYLVEREKFGLALQPIIAFRNRNVLDISPDALSTIHLNRTGVYPAEYTITRAKPEADGPPAPTQSADAKSSAKPGDWKLDGFDASAVKTLISRLAPLRATQWLNEPPVTTPEGVSITLTLADGKTHKLFIHPQSRTGRVDGISAAFKVDDALAEAVQAELRNTVVLPYEHDQIKQVKIGGVTVTRSDGKFSVTGQPSGHTLDEAAAGQLFDTLAGLMIDHFVDASRATGEPTAVLEITAADKAHALKLWIPAEGEALGQVADKTFTLDRAKAEMLRKPPTLAPGEKSKVAPPRSAFPAGLPGGLTLPPN